MKTQPQNNPKDWIIVGACCFINMVFNGMSGVFGILFVATMDRYNVNRAKASLPFTLYASMNGITGPLVGLMDHQLGLKLVVMLGGLIGAIGIAFCYLAESIVAFILLWGAVVGLASGMATNLLPIIINQYFEKNRTCANGTAYLGASIGALLLPLIVEALLNKYHLPGTCLLLGGITLNCVPAAMLLHKPNSTSKDPSSIKDNSFQESTHITKESCNHSSSHFSKTYICKHHIGLGLSVPDKKLHGLSSPISSRETSNNKTTRNFSSLNTNNEINIEERTNQHSLLGKSSQEYCHLDAETKSNNLFLRLICDPIFVLISFTIGFSLFSYICTVTVCIDFAKDIGIQNWQEKYIVISLFVGEIFGRVGLNWVTDRHFMTAAGFTAFCFLGQGVTLATISMSNNAIMIISIMALYGIFEAALINIIPVNIGQYIDQNLQKLAMPSSRFITGILVFLVSPIIGVFRDVLGSYVGIFYLNVLLSFLGSISWLISKRLIQRKVT